MSSAKPMSMPNAQMNVAIWNQRIWPKYQQQPHTTSATVHRMVPKMNALRRSTCTGLG